MWPNTLRTRKQNILEIIKIELFKYIKFKKVSVGKCFCNEITKTRDLLLHKIVFFPQLSRSWTIHPLFLVAIDPRTVLRGCRCSWFPCALKMLYRKNKHWCQKPSWLIMQLTLLCSYNLHQGLPIKFKSKTFLLIAMVLNKKLLQEFLYKLHHYPSKILQEQFLSY